MRLAYLSTDRGIAFGGHKGAAVHLAEMVEALAKEQVDVLLLVASAEGPVASQANVSVEVIPGVSRIASSEERRQYDRELTNWLVQRLAEFRPDAVYERLALYTAAGATAARQLGIPHLVELNAPLLEEEKRFRNLELPALADELEATTVRAADLVLAVSPPLADYARSRGARRVEVSPNAAAVEKFEVLSSQRGAPRAVFAGSLRPWHGLETINAAWQLLGAAAPPLLVVGDGPARHLLADVASEFAGQVPPERVPALLASADIGLAPYGRDTPRYFSPIKLFEYLAAGLATVVGDLPAVTSVVDGTNAVVIPAGDAKALADAVARLGGDVDERRRLGRNGRELIAKSHTWRHRARRVQALVAHLATAGAPA